MRITIDDWMTLSGLMEEFSKSQTTTLHHLRRNKARIRSIKNPYGHGYLYRVSDVRKVVQHTLDK